MSSCYSPELKAPQKMPEIDPGKPAMAGMLKILCRTCQKQTEAFVPAAGVRLRRETVCSRDGAEIFCFLVEPEQPEKSLPGLLMIHGGAFYLPVQTSALDLACEYAKGLNARVIVPEYRLVPGCPAPKALEDCEAVWTAMRDRRSEWKLDPEKLLVAGDSAGAALAAGLCIRLRDQGSSLPAGQMLIYPVLDDRQERYPSYERFPDARWSAASTKTMWSAYLKGADESLLSALVPARCPRLEGLPPAYVEPQEIDVLRDEAVAWAEALKAADVPVILNIVAGSYHGFDSDLTSPLVRRVIGERIRAASSFLN